jgi:hypothetical protein
MELTNAGKGGITLPLRTGPDGAIFPCRVRKDGTSVPLVPCLLLERESIDVPSWYIDELLVEDGHGTRLRNGTLVLSGEAPALPAPETAPAEPEPAIEPETTEPEPTNAPPAGLAEVTTEAPALPAPEAAPADAPPVTGKGKKRRG